MKDTEGTGAATATEAAPAPQGVEGGDQSSSEPQVPAWKQKLNDIREAGTFEAYAEKHLAGAEDDGEEEAPEGHNPGAGEGAESTVPETVPEEEEGDELEGELEDGGEEGDQESDDESVTFALPGRQPDDDDFELTLPRAALEEAGYDLQELTERMAQMRNGYERNARIREAQADLEARELEFEDVVTELKENPVAFVTGSIQNPKLREEVVTSILAELDDEAFERVLDKADGWSRKPGDREKARVEAENERLRSERDRSKRQEVTKEQRERAQQIVEQIESHIPEGWDGTGRDQRFFTTALETLRAYKQEQKLDALDPSEVPDLLRELGVLEDYGIGKEKPSSKPAPKAGKKKADPPQDPKTRMRRRREAAAVSPAGAGGEGAPGSAPPKGQSFKERIAWIRKHRT